MGRPTRLLVATAALSCVLSVVPAGGAPQTQPRTRPAEAGGGKGDAAKGKGWQVAAGDGFAIAVPAGWRPFEHTPPRMVLFRQGDGIGLPAVDETGSPLQVGLTVERFPDTKDTPAEGAKALLRAAKANPRLELVGEATTEAVKLADGTEAVLLTTEFVKEGTRRSLQMKLVAKDKAGTGWVVGGFLVGGKESKVPTKDSRPALWLRAHLASFCLDPAKVDEMKLAEAYQAYQKGQ